MFRARPTLRVDLLSTAPIGSIRKSAASRRGRALSTAAVLVLAAPALAIAAPAKTDPKTARIEQLEQEMQQLMQDNQQLHSQEQAVEARAQQLESEVDDLKRGQAAEIQTVQDQAQSIQTVQAKIPSPPAVIDKMLNGRPVFSSADGRFSLTVHTVMQLDTGGYFQDSPGPIVTDLRRSGPALGSKSTNIDYMHAAHLKDGTDFRRARLGVDGTVFGDWDYRLLLDFAGSGVENTGQLYETWVQYSGFKPLRLRVGALPPTIGMEDSASTGGMPFMERTAIEDMARGLAAGDTRLTGQVYGYGDHWLASGAVTGRTIGVLNTGTASAVPQTFGDQVGLVGRLAASPFYGKDWLVHFGVHGSYVDRPANTTGPNSGALPNGSTPISSYVVAFSNTQQLRIDGTKFINTGNIDARSAYTAGVEFAAQKGPFIIQSEYEKFGVKRTDITSDPTFSGWYVEGLWSITGEPRVYNKGTAAFDAPIPEHPFSWKDGTWGAWELGARYSDADLNYHEGYWSKLPSVDAIRGGDEKNVSLDLNWYPNPVVKFMLDFEHVKIDRLSPCTASGASSCAVWVTPVGAQIGQTYNAVAIRSQFAF